MTSSRRILSRALLMLSSALVLTVVGCVETPDPALERAEEALRTDASGKRHARGAFSCDLVLDGTVPLSEVPAVIERDRMHMTRQAGFQSKTIPIVPDFQTGNLLSGGRYLFDRYQDAEAYLDFVQNGFVLGGVQFLDRDLFLDSECYAWKVVGAREFAPLESQSVVRTERIAYDTSVRGVRGKLQRAWKALSDEAEQRGYAAVWLLYNDDERLAQVVYWTERGPTPEGEFDFAGLGALEGAPALGEPLAQRAGWTRVFDRTQWVLTTWYPFIEGDAGQPSTWPNSPPLPEPTCGDGVCEGSRGEDGSTCSADCTAQCGDAICQSGEDEFACPGDCSL